MAWLAMGWIFLFSSSDVVVVIFFGRGVGGSGVTAGLKNTSLNVLLHL
jgi:hypothetical protein